MIDSLIDYIEQTTKNLKKLKKELPEDEWKKFQKELQKIVDD